MTTQAAFASIANMLRLECTKEEDGFNVHAITCELPHTLVPTLQQLMIPHRAYVDMMPWPSFRDRVLTSLAVINQPEFLHDLLSGDLKIWGKFPWDPTGWEVGGRLASKWWFLMDDGIIQTTNF